MKLSDIARRSQILRVGATVKRANDPSGFLLITKAWGKAAIPGARLKFRGLKIKFSGETTAAGEIRPGKPVVSAEEEGIANPGQGDWQLVAEETQERATLVQPSVSEGVETFRLSDAGLALAKAGQAPFDWTAEDGKARELVSAFKTARQERLAVTAAATTKRLQELAAARVAAKQKKKAEA